MYVAPQSGSRALRGKTLYDYGSFVPEYKRDAGYDNGLSIDLMTGIALSIETNLRNQGLGETLIGE